MVFQNLQIGKIKWFSSRKGFGFITRKDDEDVYFHYTAIRGSDGFRLLCNGQKVLYEISPKRRSKNGPHANFVTPLSYGKNYN